MPQTALSVSDASRKIILIANTRWLLLYYSVKKVFSLMVIIIAHTNVIYLLLKCTLTVHGYDKKGTALNYLHIHNKQK